MTTNADAGAGSNEPGTGGGAEGGAGGTPDPNAAPGNPQPNGQGNQGANDTGEVTFEMKLPDGVELDQAAADEFKAIVSDKALTASQRAQKIVDLAVKREADRVEAFKTRVQSWIDEVKADKEIGGDKLDETLAVAKKAIDLGPPGLKEYLDASGLGNHPVMVRWAYTIGKALSEDGFVRGDGRGDAKSGDPSERYANSLYK